eukprot:gene9611-11778_t
MEEEFMIIKEGILLIEEEMIEVVQQPDDTSIFREIISKAYNEKRASLTKSFENANCLSILGCSMNLDTDNLTIELSLPQSYQPPLRIRGRNNEEKNSWWDSLSPYTKTIYNSNTTTTTATKQQQQQFPSTTTSNNNNNDNNKLKSQQLSSKSLPDLKLHSNLVSDSPNIHHRNFNQSAPSQVITCQLDTPTVTPRPPREWTEDEAFIIDLFPHVEASVILDALEFCGGDCDEVIALLSTQTRLSFQGDLNNYSPLGSIGSGISGVGSNISGKHHGRSPSVIGSYTSFHKSSPISSGGSRNQFSNSGNHYHNSSNNDDSDTSRKDSYSSSSLTPLSPSFLWQPSSVNSPTIPNSLTNSNINIKFYKNNNKSASPSSSISSSSSNQNFEEDGDSNDSSEDYYNNEQNNNQLKNNNDNEETFSSSSSPDYSQTPSVSLRIYQQQQKSNNHSSSINDDHSNIEDDDSHSEISFESKFIQKDNSCNITNNNNNNNNTTTTSNNNTDKNNPQQFGFFTKTITLQTPTTNNNTNNNNNNNQNETKEPKVQLNLITKRSSFENSNSLNNSKNNNDHNISSWGYKPSPSKKIENDNQNNLHPPISSPRSISPSSPSLSSPSATSPNWKPSSKSGRAWDLTVTITGYIKLKDHVEYRIHVKTSHSEWSVYRRYNNFLLLDKKLRSLGVIGKKDKLTLPPKQLRASSEDVTRSRQQSLQQYLGSLLENYQGIFYSNKLVNVFLNCDVSSDIFQNAAL